MPRRFIDLSVALENDVAADPPGYGPKLKYVSHQEGAAHLAACFPALTVAELPEQQGWATELVQMTTHNGTHMDAPWHYHATQDAALPSGRRPAMKIDELPLDWCWRPAVKLDFRHLADGYVVTASDVERELEHIGHAVQPLDVVVMNTAAGAAYGRPDYVSKGCGGPRSHALSRGQRCADCRQGRVVLGRAIRLHRASVASDARSRDNLGGSQGRSGDRLFPNGKAAQSGFVATERL